MAFLIHNYTEIRWKSYLLKGGQEGKMLIKHCIFCERSLCWSQEAIDECALNLPPEREIKKAIYTGLEMV